MIIAIAIPNIPNGVLYHGGFSWEELLLSDLAFIAFHSLTFASILLINFFKACL